MLDQNSPRGDPRSWSFSFTAGVLKVRTVVQNPDSQSVLSGPPNKDRQSVLTKRKSRGPWISEVSGNLLMWTPKQKV